MIDLKISDVAERANVSKGTVSKVFNNYPNVSDQMRERVLDAVTDMGGDPSAISGRNRVWNNGACKTFAINLGNASIFNRAMNAPRWSNDRCVAAFHERLSELGHHLLIMPNFTDSGSLMRYLKAHYQKQFDAVAFLENIREDVVEYLIKQEIPTISMGGSRLNLPGCSVVNVSAADGIGQVMDHLLELGHRRIGFIGWWMNHDSMSERYQEYFFKLRMAGLDFIPEFVYEGRKVDLTALKSGSYWEEQFLEVVAFIDGLIKSKKLPTAFVCATDDVAYRVSKYLAEKGISVPGDISVTGWGNDYSDEKPALTTIDDNAGMRGRNAADHLIQVCGHIPGVAMRVNVPCELVVGDTTGRAKQS